MKFSLAAIFGAVAAHNDAEMFLQEQVSLAGEVYVAPQPNDISDKIGSGMCQGFFGENVYDLKHFDSMNRDMAKMTAAIAVSKTNTADDIFAYKVCQNAFHLKAGILGAADSQDVKDTLSGLGANKYDVAA